MNNHPWTALLLTMLISLTAIAGNGAAYATLKPWKQGATPVLELKDLQGVVRTLDEFRGKVVIVNFWATWCEPCVEEMPSLQMLKQRLGGEDFAVIGVNMGEGEVRIKSFTDKTGTTFPILLDRDGVAKKNWKVNGVPATFVLDATGRIRFWSTGALDFSDERLVSQVMNLLPGKTGRKRP